jgi:hypothetical protein
MKRLRIVGLCLVAAFALSAITVASASATAPEFGKCEKVTSGGAYKDAGCTKPETGTKGKYNWVADATGVKFKAHMTGSLATLEGEKGSKITCTAEHNENAAYTGPKTVGNIVAEFEGCETSGLKCHSAGAGEGDITTNPLEGLLGNEKPKKLEVQLHGPGHGALAEFECSSAVKIVVTGCVAHPVTTDKMELNVTEKFTQSKGEQKPDKFEGGPTDECALASSLNGGAPEESGQTITALLENETKVEANYYV